MVDERVMVFISHGSRHRELVSRIVDLLTVALHLPTQAVWATRATAYPAPRTPRPSCAARSRRPTYSHPIVAKVLTWIGSIRVADTESEDPDTVCQVTPVRASRGELVPTVALTRHDRRPAPAANRQGRGEPQTALDV